MAALSATLLAAAPAAATAAKPATSFSGLARVSVPCKAAPAPALRAIANDVKTRQMKVWQPTDNKYFETFSFLPPLTEEQIAKQVDYIIDNAWVPCIEFADADKAYVAQTHSQRMGPVTSTYEDNRYWTMFKLPMFGCNDPSQVLREMDNAIKAFPNAYIRLVAFDNVRQTQVCGFLLHRPPNVTEYRPVEERSV